MAADEANTKGTSKAGAGHGSGRAKTPVTIDLEAKVVPPGQTGSGARADATGATEPAASETAARPQEARGADSETAAEAADRGERPAMHTASTESRPGLVTLAVAGAIGGLIVMIFGFGLQAAGVLPAPGRTEATQALTEAGGLTGTVSALDQRVMSIEAASAQTIADRALLDDLSRQVGVVDAFGTSLSDRLLNVEASIASLGERVGSGGDPAAKQALDAIAERVGRLESTPPAAGGGAPAPALADLGGRVDGLAADIAALEALRSRVDTLANDVAALGARLDGFAKTPVPATENERAARAIAIGSLRQAASRGGPFAADLTVIGALGIGPGDVAALVPLAEKGAPSRDDLIAGFPSVIDAILAAPQSPGDGGGLIDRVLSYGRGLVKIRPTGPISGSDPVAVVSRMQAAVDAGDLAEALSERAALPAAGQAASQKWATDVADRLAIDRLVEEIATALGVAEGSG